MMSNNKKKRPRWVWLIILLFLAINIPGIKNIMVVNKQLHSLRQEEARLQKEHRELQEEVRQLNSPAEIERLAREELGMVRPGEKLLVPVESTGSR